MISDGLIIAILLNLVVLAIAYLSGYKALMISSSIVWVIIGIFTYQEIEDKLILSILFLIAAGSAFLPSKEKIR